MCSSAAAVGQRDVSLGYCCLTVNSVHSSHLYSNVLCQRSTRILNILAKASAAYHICFRSQAILCNLWNWFLNVQVDQKIGKYTACLASATMPSSKPLKSSIHLLHSRLRRFQCIVEPLRSHTHLQTTFT